MYLRLATIVAAGLFAASVVAAMLPEFSELDTDGNGMLSLTELEVLEEFQGDDSDFVEADQNDDRSLSQEEYQAWAKKEAAND